MARMKILNNLEREAFESPPQFNSAERKLFFSLPKAFIEVLENLRTPTNRACLVLSFGYFKSQRRFFGKQFREQDIAYVARQLSIDIDEVDVKTYDWQTLSRHQALILSHFGVSPFDAEGKDFLAKEIAALVRVQLRPKLIFVEAVEALSKRKIEIPSYSALSTLILKEMSKYQKELVTVIDKNLSKAQRKKLDELLSRETEDEDSWRYPITLLKKPLRSTEPRKIKVKLADLKTLLALYLDLKPVVTKLKMNNETIRYYAYLVIKAQIPQVSRRQPDENRYLLLIMFIVYQTFKQHDALIDTLLSAVQATVNAAEKGHKESYYQEREGRKQSFIKLAATLKSRFTGTLSQIRAIIADHSLNAAKKVEAIEILLNEPMPKLAGTDVDAEIDDFTRKLSNAHQGRDYYALLEEQSIKLQNRVAEIVRQVQFNPSCSRPALFRAIQYYQRRSGSLDKNTPVDFLPPEQQAALIGPKGKFRVSLYKAFLYIAVADAIKAGALNLIHSEKYRSLDEYLIPKEDWDARRDEYLQRADLARFKDCRPTLKTLEEALDAGYKQANDNLIDGKNTYLKFRKDNSFYVTTPKLDEVEALSLSSFFPERKYISMLEALATVAVASDFLAEFEHWQIKSRLKRPHPKVIFAGIIGYGCDIGHRKLAQISKQLNENELETTVNWYFSLATAA